MASPGNGNIMFDLTTNFYAVRLKNYLKNTSIITLINAAINCKTGYQLTSEQQGGIPPPL